MGFPALPVHLLFGSLVRHAPIYATPIKSIHPGGFSRRGCRRWEVNHDIGRTILQQIRGLDRWALARWGITGLSGRTEVVLLEAGVRLLLVRGRRIDITLDPDDTYTIKVARMVKKYETILGHRVATDAEEKVEYEMSDVYCDGLVQVIESGLKKAGFLF